MVLVAGQGGEWRSRTAATVAGTPGLQRADAAPELVATREDAGPQVVLDRAQSPLRVAARRADGEDRPRARRVLAAGQGSSEPSMDADSVTCLSNFRYISTVDARSKGFCCFQPWLGLSLSPVKTTQRLPELAVRAAASVCGRREPGRGKRGGRHRELAVGAEDDAEMERARQSWRGMPRACAARAESGTAS